MKSTLIIENVSKSYGDFTALKDINLTIPMGEFTCFLGPSGCGKTTLLRLIAGFEQPTGGRILLDGRDITALPPQKRELGVVFQSLALFPHMSVSENIAYGLRRKRVPAAQQQSRVEQLLAMVRLAGMGGRAVTALSGGQKQRVAIARALAVDPKLFLLDEPLSALDARLRDQMQIELRELQQRLRITTLFVTHDQSEAMMLADSIAVFSDGRLQQFGKPGDVYRRPATAFVADFLGAANLVRGTVGANGDVEAMGVRIPAIAGQVNTTLVELAMRAEDLALAPLEGAVAIPGRLHLARNLGGHREVLVDCGDGTVLRSQSSLGQDAFGAPGSPITLYIQPGAISVFASGSTVS